MKLTLTIPEKYLYLLSGAAVMLALVVVAALAMNIGHADEYLGSVININAPSGTQTYADQNGSVNIIVPTPEPTVQPTPWVILVTPYPTVDAPAKVVYVNNPLSDDAPVVTDTPTDVPTVTPTPVCGSLDLIITMDHNFVNGALVTIGSDSVTTVAGGNAILNNVPTGVCSFVVSYNGNNYYGHIDVPAYPSATLSYNFNEEIPVTIINGSDV